MCQVQGSGLAGAPPWVLLGLRAAPKEEAGVSAAEATYGHSLVLPSQLQPPPRAPQAAPTCPTSRPIQGGCPQQGEDSQGGGEGLRGGGPGGIPHVLV